MALEPVAPPVSVDGPGVGQLFEAFFWRRPVCRQSSSVLAFSALAYGCAVQAILFRRHAHTWCAGCSHVRRTLDAGAGQAVAPAAPRSEEHTSELQSRENLVCRLLL